MFWKYSLSMFAVFSFMYMFEMFLNGFLLVDFYQQTTALLAEGKTFAPNTGITFVIQALLAVVLTCLFDNYCTKKCVSGGAAWGLSIGILMALVRLGCFAFMPLSFSMMIVWVIVSVFEGIGIGVILSETFRMQSAGGSCSAMECTMEKAPAKKVVVAAKKPAPKAAPVKKAANKKAVKKKAKKR